LHAWEATSARYCRTFRKWMTAVNAKPLPSVPLNDFCELLA
jgi:hypothetical protein